MDLAEGYGLLGLQQGAGLEEVKKAFRGLAFELHPDLNPDPAAGRRFQRLNEAYVLVKAHLEGGAKAAPGADKARKPPQPPPGPRKAAEQPKAKPRETAKPKAQAYYRKEEVLQDILKDAFARKVFEDIYNEIRRGGGSKSPARSGKVPSRRKMRLEWGDREVTLDLSQGLWGSIKSWLRRQLDHEQVLKVDPSGIRPGGVVRLQVSGSGMSGKVQTIDVTLPVGYAAGRPIRLKGLGRKLGRWQGDLIVRLLAK